MDGEESRRGLQTFLSQDALLVDNIYEIRQYAEILKKKTCLVVSTNLPITVPPKYNSKKYIDFLFAFFHSKTVIQDVWNKSENPNLLATNLKDIFANSAFWSGLEEVIMVINGHVRTLVHNRWQE
ncbi:hypothetical protein HK098_007704 [Nowakowskiella sp. JEL0407]|nr:hypothetical protein HK098_007704 [Nowakowskiella sp. JEL0407]